MIGQIERGESSPTLTTIWKIANGLKVSFTTLINQPQPETEVIILEDVQVLTGNKGRYRIYPYFPFQEENRFEIYTVEIDHQGKLIAEAHRDGTEEFITVFDGELALTINDKQYTLKTGDSIRFKADRPHSYFNPSQSLTRLSMTIYYPV